jgi:sec-independent protein translocase protein TatB
MAVLTATAATPGAIIGILESLSGVEFMVIALFAFLVLGPEKLPDAMRRAGKLLGEVRKVTSGFQEEVRAAMAEAEAATKLPEGFSDLTGDSSTAAAPDDPGPGGPPPDGAPSDSDEPS